MKPQKVYIQKMKSGKVTVLLGKGSMHYKTFSNQSYHHADISKRDPHWYFDGKFMVNLKTNELLLSGGKEGIQPKCLGSKRNVVESREITVTSIQLYETYAGSTGVIWRDLEFY